MKVKTSKERVKVKKVEMKIKSELSPPRTLKRGQVEYDKGEKKGEEGET